MTELQARWLTDPVFIFIKKLLLEEATPPSGMSLRDWFKYSAPKTKHPIGGESLDCREIDLSNLKIGEYWLNYVLDGGQAQKSTFANTCFQSASAQCFNFTDSHFIVAQMSPIYARSASFKNCTFNRCFLMGIGPEQEEKGHFSDLRDCDFSNVQAIKTGLSRCDFRYANFSNAKFEDCDFCESDLRGVNLSGASFQNCDFRAAKFDADPSIRELLKKGQNLEVQRINWVLENNQ